MEDFINWADNSSGVTEPITITLDGEGNTSVDFEQAFGDYSEARGRRRERRRARRQERKLRRINRRQERKNARVDARLQRKQRIADARATRKGGDEEGGEEAGSDEAPMPTNDTGSNEPTSGGSVAPIEDSPSPLPPSYPPSDDSEANDTAEEEQAVEEETGASDEESGFTGDYGFDGQRQPSQIDAYWDNFYSSAEGTERINPKVKELSRRIEKNKELAKHVEQRIAKINARVQASGKPINNIDRNVMGSLDNQLARVRSRIAELETKLAGYSRFIGEYSDASGEQREENARRRAEVRQAKRSARKERQSFIKQKRKSRVKELMGEFLAQGMTRQEARMKARQQAKAENPYGTAVAPTLNASISPNKIDVPPSEATSGFNGTGLIGLDDYNDFDAPPTRNVELDFSNASGKMKGNWKWIAIGVVVAVGGIFAYNKFIKKR